MKIYLLIILMLFLGCDDKKEIYGCTNQSACNFNPNATIFDDTCTYESELYDCDNVCKTGDYNCNIIGDWVLKMASGFYSHYGSYSNINSYENCVDYFQNNQFLYYSKPPDINDNEDGCLGDSSNPYCNFFIDEDLFISDWFLNLFHNDYANINICNLDSESFSLCDDCNDCDFSQYKMNYTITEDSLLSVIFYEDFSAWDNCSHYIFSLIDDYDELYFGCLDEESCDYDSNATDALYGNSCEYIGDYNLCDDSCNHIAWSQEIGYNSSWTTNIDNRIGGYTPASFAWYQTNNVLGDPDEYALEIYIPNYENFCTLDNAKCYTSDHVLITEDNYDTENIAYIDLPHDNLGLTPVALDENGIWDLVDGTDIDTYDQQYFTSAQIQTAITGGEFILTDCNAFSADGVMWFPGIGGNPHNTELYGDANWEPCNADIIYENEYSFQEDQYGLYNPYGNKEKNTCAIPPLGP